jgi:drug/metabolite transporter (DMT)-like permease
MTPGRRSMLLAAAFVALWAAVEALGARLEQRYSPYQVIFTRYVVHLGLLLALFGWREPASLWRTRRPLYQLARSSLMLCMPAAWIVATQLGVHPGTVLSIFWLAPLLVLWLARLVLGERASAPVWIATAVASGAAAVASGPGPLPDARLLVLPVGMAASFSLYVAMTRSLRSETTLANLFYTALGVVLALSPAMARLWVAPPLHDLLVMVGIGALGLAALWALDRMAAAAPVSRSAPLACLQVVFVLGLEWALRRRHPSAPAAVAALLVGATALYTWAREPGLVAEGSA